MMTDPTSTVIIIKKMNPKEDLNFFFYTTEYHKKIG